MTTELDNGEILRLLFLIDFAYIYIKVLQHDQLSDIMSALCSLYLTVLIFEFRGAFVSQSQLVVAFASFRSMRK